MTRRPLAALALFTLALIALGTTVSSAAPVTIGQTLPGSTNCASAPRLWFIQTSPASYAVPAGNWNITSWSTHAGPLGGSMGLMVFRNVGIPGTPDLYTVVGASSVEALTANSLNTFTLAVPIAVQGGDLLGLFATAGTACGMSGTGKIEGSERPAPPVGATVIPELSNSSVLGNISATLSPALPTRKAQCKKGGWKQFRNPSFKNQGQCVKYANHQGGKNNQGKDDNKSQGKKKTGKKK
jgi:hypothetical protein